MCQPFSTRVITRSFHSVPARPPKVIQKSIFDNIQSGSCDEVEIAS